MPSQKMSARSQEKSPLSKPLFLHMEDKFTLKGFWVIEHARMFYEFKVY